LKTDKLRGKWPLYLAIIISLAVAYYAFNNLYPLVYEKEAYVQSLVTSKEIKPFVKITNEDLGVKKVLKSNLPKDAIYLGLYFPEPIQMLVNSKQTQYSSLYQINDTGLLLLFEEPCEEQI
jgi:hypothetical protein